MAENPLNRDEMDELFDAVSKCKKKEDSISQDEIDFLLSGGASGSSGTARKSDVADGNKTSASNKNSASNEFIGRRIKIYDFKRQDIGTKTQRRETEALGEKVAEALAYTFYKKFGKGFSLKCISCDYLTSGEFLRSVPKPAFLYFENLDTGDFLIEADSNLAHIILKQPSDAKIEKSDLEAFYAVFTWEIVNAFIKEIAWKTGEEIKLQHSEPFFDPDTAPPEIEKDEGGILLAFEMKIGEKSGMVNIHICKNLFDSLKSVGFFSDTNKNVIELSSAECMEQKTNLFAEFNRAVYDSSALKMGNTLVFPHYAGSDLNLVSDGKIIACGEACVIDENFGIRITETLASPEDVKTEGYIALTLGKTFAEKDEIAKFEEGKIIELDSIMGEKLPVVTENGVLSYGNIFVQDDKIAFRVSGEDKNVSVCKPDVRAEFKKIPPATLVEMLEAESVRTVAIVISSLGKSEAAALLEKLGEDRRIEIFEEIAHGERIGEELLELTLSDILTKVHEIESKHYVKLGGLDFAAEVTEFLPLSTERRLIERLEEYDNDLAEEIKKRIFVFEDIVMISDRDIQKILRETDYQVLARALKNADDDVKEKVFRNMSKRAAEMLKEDIEFIGPIREKDRDEARMKIVATIKALDEKGEIVISCNTEEDYIE